MITSISTLDVCNQATELAQFRAEVLHGLRQPDKELPSRYFYDERGSHLFEAICTLDEYYPTRTELAIMQAHAAEMAVGLGPRCLLIEFGSGSSQKTYLLLDHLVEPAAYIPIDISAEQLREATQAVSAHYPELEVLPLCADFTRPLHLPSSVRSARRRVVYFPGSTVGNLTPVETVRLLRRVVRLCGPGGGLLIGIDLKKDIQILERAYNDRRGITRAFNLNLLCRLNRELGADFRLDRFRHRAFYNAELGRVEMHLVSQVNQTVHLGTEQIYFTRGESIRTEYSYKHTVAEFAELARAARLTLEQVWQDEQRWFGVLYFATPRGGAVEVGSPPRPW